MWRGVSIRKLSFLTFGPMVIEASVNLMGYWMIVRAYALGYQPNTVMFIAAAGSGGYCLSSILAGKWATTNRAPYLMILAIFGATLSGLLGVYFDAFPTFLIASFFMGAFVGQHYVPFQINMSHVKPFRTLAFSIAFYNMSWATGAAVGTYIAAENESASFLFFLPIALTFAAAHLVLNTIATRAPNHHHHEEKQTIAFFSTPLHRRIGWIATAVTTLCYRGIYSNLWPALCILPGYEHLDKGIGVLALSLPVPLGAILWAKLRHQLHHPFIMIALLLFGAIGLLIIPFTTSALLIYTALFIVSTADSITVFTAIFYCNADPDVKSRPRSIGIFEALVGFGYMAGPLVFGLLAWKRADRLAPYLAGATILIITTSVLSYLWLSRKAHHQST